MASTQAVAVRRSAALQSIRNSQERIAAETGVDIPNPATIPSTDVDLRHVSELEGVASFLVNVTSSLTGEKTMSTNDNTEGGIQPDHEGGKVDTQKEQVIREVRTDANAKIAEAHAKAAQSQAADSSDVEDASNPEDVRYGAAKHPLSYFDGKSDEDILKLKGISNATLKKIRDAQAAQKKCRHVDRRP